MRVISGQARGLKLKAPDGMDTRPTTDRIKESFFNIINQSIYDADFLDLFGGSGAIGLEALSRGAKSAVIVDESRKSIDVINDNLTRASLSDKARVIKGNALAVLDTLATEGLSFDIIFLDPPYGKGLTETALLHINRCKLLRRDGFIVAEQATDEKEIANCGFDVYRIKSFGKTTKMTFLRNTEENR